MDAEAKKKAREEYLRKYLDPDKETGKKRKRKKKKINGGLTIHEEDAFVTVAPAKEGTSSEDEQEEEVKVLLETKLKQEAKFKKAAFHVVDGDDIRKTEASSSGMYKSVKEEPLDEDDVAAAEPSGKLKTVLKLQKKTESAGAVDLSSTLAKRSRTDKVSSSARCMIKEEIDSDNSPVRRGRGKRSGSDEFPPRRRVRSDSEPDASPPRMGRKRHELSTFSRGKMRHDSDSDISLPRRRSHLDSSQRERTSPFECGIPSEEHGSATSLSKRRRPRHDSESDISPPRYTDRTTDSDTSPPRRRPRHDSYSDISSRRREERSKEGHRTSSDRRKAEKGHEQNSGHRERRRYGSDGSRTHERSDRKHTSGRNEREYGHHKSRRQDSSRERSPSATSKYVESEGRLAKTTDGKSAGLQTLAAHREEMEQLKEIEEKAWENIDTVKDAEAVRRKKLTGKKRETKEDAERKQREAEKQKELEEKYKKWSKGLRQIEERNEKLNEMVRVAQEGFARYADDEAMNKHLKEQLLEKDPMYKYVKKKKEKAEQRSGTAMPKYKGSWPANRFGIPPGYRWDGVNRSNGFEEKIAETSNRKAAQRTEYYESLTKYEV